MNSRLKDRIVNKSRQEYNENGDIYQHFTAVIDRNKIVSWGRNNRKKTDTWSFRHGYTYFKIHSELAAIKNFPYPLSRLNKYTIVNLRLNKQLEIINSKPCLKCIKLLDFFGISEVIYSNEEGRFVNL